MKRLLRIGFGLFIYSIIPVLCWIVLAIIEGDNRISNVFSIIYPIQFLWMILTHFFGSGANIRQEKDNSEHSTLNGIFWGTIFSVLIFASPMIFVDGYINFFGQDVEFYRIYVLYGIALIFLQTIFSLFMEKLYFEDKEKAANLNLLIFNLLNFGVLTISALIFTSRLIPLLITISVLLGYIIFLFIWQMKKFKIKFDFYKNFRYESAAIISAIFMFVIYFFGFKNAFISKPEYLVALNLAGLCTDPLWDCLVAIKTATKVDISKGRFEYKKMVNDAFFFSLIMIAISLSMTVAVYFIYDVGFWILLLFVSLQFVDMIFYQYYIIILIYTQIEYSPLLCTTINLLAKVARTGISVFIFSPFCTEFGQIAEAVLCYLIFLIIRFTFFKVDKGKLFVKQKNEIKKQDE